MDANIAEIVIEAAFHERAARRIQRVSWRTEDLLNDRLKFFNISILFIFALNRSCGRRTLDPFSSTLFAFIRSGPAIGTIALHSVRRDTHYQIRYMFGFP